MALKKLEEMGYKPRKKMKVEEEGVESEVESILKRIEKSNVKRRILNLLFEALSESDPREILVYGMYIKKHLTPVVPAMRGKRIAKNLEWLGEAVKLIEKSGRK